VTGEKLTRPVERLESTLSPIDSYETGTFQILARFRLRADMAAGWEKSPSSPMA